MRTCSRRNVLAIAVSLLLLSCGKGKDEETIRITIDKGGQKVTAEPVEKPTPRRQEPVGGGAARVVPTQPPSPPPAAREPGAADAGIAFAAAAARLDVIANGPDGAKRNWGALKGKTVTWSGTVQSVDVGRGGFKLYVRAADLAPAKRYNIVVAGDGQVAAAKTLRPGDPVRFTGSIHRADYGRGPSDVLIVLADGRLR